MFKAILRKIFSACFLSVLVFSSVSCAAGKLERKSVKIDTAWKFKAGDNLSYALPSYDDSSWQSRNDLKKISFDEIGNYFWVRSTISVPADLSSKDLWLGFKKFNAAAEVYADGVYVGSRGKMPPAVNIKIEEEDDIHIPENCIKDGKINLAIRFYLPGNSFTNPDLHLDNGDQAFFQNTVKSQFNQKIFIMLAVALFFVIIYSLLQYLVDTRDSAYLYFILSVTFIIFYFLDLGSQNQFFSSYNFQRSITRCCLGIGMSFMILFMNRFFNRNHKKFVTVLTVFISALLFILFMANIGKDAVIDTLFLVGLVVVVGTIAYGFVCTIQAIKRGQKDVAPILIGFILGTAIAVHDIIYQVIGIVPFMWIQGLAFFVLDFSIFITLAIRQFKSKHDVKILADETAKQKENLSQIIENAKKMADESNQIAAALSESVGIVVRTSEQTQAKINDINVAIAEQTRVRTETDTAVHNLTGFLDELSREFDTETEIISKTVKQTQDVIDGITTVGEGVYTAAEFTTSLSSLTKESSEETKNLIKVMDQVQASSNEILGVVTTLDTFANKIDLLSMNASIEAAHSGVAGKGFSVIAHEIKNLASQTQQWSAKIGEIITSVIGSIEESARMAKKLDGALSKINEGSVISAQKVNSASDGMKIQKQAGDAITEDSKILYQSADKMQKEVKNQSNFSAQVLGNMEALSIASNSVNSASEEIAKEFDSLNQEAKKLNELAERTSISAQELLKLMEEE